MFHSVYEWVILYSSRVQCNSEFKWPPQLYV